jgi:hypothetical protein
MFTDGFNELNSEDTFGQYKVKVTMYDPMLMDIGSFGSEIPCVTIARINKVESNQFIGEDITENDNIENRVLGRYYNDIFELRVWAPTPLLREDIYESVLKILLTQQDRYLKNNPIKDINGEDQYPYGEDYSAGIIMRITGAVDEQDPDFLDGHPMFFTTIQISILNPVMWQDNTVYGKYSELPVIGNDVELRNKIIVDNNI